MIVRVRIRVRVSGQGQSVRVRVRVRVGTCGVRPPVVMVLSAHRCAVPRRVQMEIEPG